MPDAYLPSGELVRVGGLGRLTARLSIVQEFLDFFGTVTAWRHPDLTAGRLHLAEPSDDVPAGPGRRSRTLVVVGRPRNPSRLPVCRCSR